MHLLPLGSDMEAATTPELWHAAQPLLPWARTLADPSLSKFASALWNIWPALLRQARPEVRVDPQRFTLLPVPFPFMVPGVRFREGYYWDNYFVIHGLLAGGATATAQNQVLNMADLIQRYGHMPNGLRTYYLNRSQPPLFCLSVRAVFAALGGKFENPKDGAGVVEAFGGRSVPQGGEGAGRPQSRKLSAEPAVGPASQDAKKSAGSKPASAPSSPSSSPSLPPAPPSPSSPSHPPPTSIYASLPPMDFLRLVYPSMLHEYAYWTSDLKQVRVPSANGTHLLARYNAELEGPRPESYTEDMRTARAAGFDPVNPSPACHQLWRDLASGAESGWDYSRRWFRDPVVGLPSIRTTQILPVDLNSFLLEAEVTIADVAAALGDVAGVERMRAFAKQRHAALQDLMWDEAGGRWRDLVCDGLEARRPPPGGAVCESWHWNDGVYASDWSPLYAGVPAPGGSQAARALRALQESGLIQAGGVAASLEHSGEQWDWPNAWPPLQYLIAQGVARSCGAAGLEQGREIAERYVRNAEKAYESEGVNHEKFNATRPGEPGGGGEYEVDSGFGWTNAVALAFMREYIAA